MNTPPRKLARGVTLVELLIAMTIGLFMIGGLIQAFVASKQIYATNEALSVIQNSGRASLEILTADIRDAGYMSNCLGGDRKINNLLAAGYNATLFDMTSSSVTGWNDSAGSFSSDLKNYVSGTDVVLIKHAALDSGANANGSTDITASTITLASASNISKGSIVLIAEPTGCDLFQNQSTKNTELSRAKTGTPGNKDPSTTNLSHAYSSDMRIQLYQSMIYYVGTSTTTGASTLMRVRYDTGTAATPEDLVDGILDMQILYGVDTGGDRQIDDYVNAASVTNWSNVLALRVNLLVANPIGHLSTDAQKVYYNGAYRTMAANQMAEVFGSTIALRNNLP